MRKSDFRAPGGLQVVEMRLSESLSRTEASGMRGAKAQARIPDFSSCARVTSLSTPAGTRGRIRLVVAPTIGLEAPGIAPEPSYRDTTRPVT